MKSLKCILQVQQLETPAEFKKILEELKQTFKSIYEGDGESPSLNEEMQVYNAARRMYNSIQEADVD